MSTPDENIRPKGHPAELPWPPKVREYPPDHPARSDEELKEAFNEDWAREDFGDEFVDDLRELMHDIPFSGDWWIACFLIRWGGLSSSRDPEQLNRLLRIVEFNTCQIHLEGIDLFGMDLQHAVIHDACLNSARLERAVLEGTWIKFCDLDHASLRWAKCQNTLLTGSSLRYADLTECDLEYADLSGCDFTGATLHKARLARADVRGAQGLLFDACDVRHLCIEGNAPDPWSVLRRSYTGPWFFVHAALLVLFILPYVGRVLALTAAGESARQAQVWADGAPAPVGDVALEQSGEAARGSGAALHESRAAAHDDDAGPHGRDAPGPGEVTASSGGLSGLIKGYAEDLTLHAEGVAEERVGAIIERAVQEQAQRAAAERATLVRERLNDMKMKPAWQVLIGLDKGAWVVAIGVILLLYNGMRAVLTLRVGMLRDAEERSGITPALGEYMGTQGLDEERYWKSLWIVMRDGSVWVTTQTRRGIEIGAWWVLWATGCAYEHEKVAIKPAKPFEELGYWRLHLAMRLLVVLAIASFAFHAAYWILNTTVPVLP